MKSEKIYKRILKAIAESNTVMELLQATEEACLASDNFNKEINDYHMAALNGAITLRLLQLKVK